MSGVYHAAGVFPRFLMALAMTMLLASVASAECRARDSGCLMADSLWVDPFGDGSVVTGAPAQATPWRVGASASFQRRPLVVVAASPDPFGNEVTVLDDWWTSQWFFAHQIRRWSLGVVLPFSYGTGLGADAIASRAARSDVSGIGDPHLLARLAQRLGNMWLGVTQRITLPLGTEHSFISARGVTYAPKVAASWQLGVFGFTTELGLRLRPATQFGDLRFGSEGYAGLNTGWHYAANGRLFLEWWATPSLTRDESSAGVGRTVRRFPSEVLAATEHSWGGVDALVGVGTSIPLSQEEGPGAGGSDTFAGPPGPQVRLHLQLQARF